VAGSRVEVNQNKEKKRDDEDLAGDVVTQLVQETTIEPA
jgi:hypothetical protein